MNRLNAHIGYAQAALQQAPEVLDAVRVYLTFDVAFGMVNDLMVELVKSVVGLLGVGVQRGPFFNVLANLGLQFLLLASANNSRANLSATFEHAKDRGFVFPAGACDTALALRQVHVAGLPSDECLVRFHFAGEQLESTFC